MIGIDGCHAGWVVASGKDVPEVWIATSIDEVTRYAAPGDIALIDIPIGLPDARHNREVENQARKLLPGKSSSIFSVPCRKAVYAKDYQSANEINKSILGKGLSIQSWHICPKIREVDGWLQSDVKRYFSLIEAHPELCFHFLKGNDEILESKKKKFGLEQRIRILTSYFFPLDQIYHRCLEKIPRKIAVPDDLLDALCLWTCAKLSEQYGLKKVGDDGIDLLGLTMNMHYVLPLTS